LRIEAIDAAAKSRIMIEAASARWEIDALEAPVGEGEVFARLAGPAEAFDALSVEILARWPGATLSATDAMDVWTRARECHWAHRDGTLVKAALTPAQVPAFETLVLATNGARGWIGAGGNVGYLSFPANAPLPPFAWPALTLRGDGPLWSGTKPRFDVMARIKTALDPQGRFPGLDE
jgi:hypothetical protein